MTARALWGVTWPALRVVVAVGVLAVVVDRVGAAPFVEAVDHLTPGAVAAALLLTLVSTTCAAARWTWVANRLGLRLDLREAVPAYYRSQLLNLVLPGGVVGDVERAVRHGGHRTALAGAARAVVWERTVGQVALLGVTAVAVAALPSALQTWGVWSVLVFVLVGAALAGVAHRRRRSRRQGRDQATPVVVTELRALIRGGTWRPLLLSVAAVGAHLTLLLVALRATGATVPLATAAPLLLVVLAASSLPTSIGGWGPREGAAAWVLGAAGLSAAQGVTVAATYGVLTLVATVPGAAVVALDALPRRVGVTT